MIHVDTSLLVPLILLVLIYFLPTDSGSKQPPSPDQEG